MQCPKCKQMELVEQILSDSLISHHCGQCDGDWLSGDRYHSWQDKQDIPAQINTELYLEKPLDPAEKDGQAALCPQCHCYLSRAKIPVEQPFYLEHCLECNGFWCDKGEWDALAELNLHHSLNIIFSSEWQTKVKLMQHNFRERQVLIQKLGQELALEVFRLGPSLAANLRPWDKIS